MKLGLQHGTVYLQSYQPEWSVLFDTAHVELAGCLGSLVRGIEHVGSTAVDGLRAKPILDIAVGVTDFSKIDEITRLLTTLDYRYNPEVSDKERYVFARGERVVTHHLHLVRWRGSQWNQFIFFRDYLRQNPTVVQEYEGVKGDLANRFANDRTSYTAGKAKYIRQILAKGAPIREVTPEDAQEFLKLLHRLDQESKFMLIEPGERQTSVTKQRERLREIAKQDNKLLCTAEVNHELVGYIGLEGGDYRRNRHCGYIVIGILEEFTSLGIGNRMFSAVEDFASRNGITRLELTVMVDNQRAVALYKKRGFHIEGTRRQALVVEDSYIDEYYMAKLLVDPNTAKSHLGSD